MRNILIASLIILPVTGFAGKYNIEHLQSRCDRGDKSACSRLSSYKKSSDGETTSASVSQQKTYPNVYKALGKKIAFLRDDCKMYIEKAILGDKPSKQCSEYIKKVNAAFADGFKIDSDIKKGAEYDEALQERLENYRNELLSVNGTRKKIINQIKQMIADAKRNNNTSLFSSIIEGKSLKLKDDDYKFMKNHHEVFKNNSRYIAYISEIEAKKMQEERKAKQEREERRRRIAEHNRRIMEKAKKDLEMQIKYGKSFRLRRRSITNLLAHRFLRDAIIGREYFCTTWNLILYRNIYHQ